MKQDFNFQNFEENYKKQVENTTPDLWSRIEDGISASEQMQGRTQSFDKDYFNQAPVVQPSNKAYTKKMLALAASVCFIVAAGFAISMSGISDTDFKSMDSIQSDDKYAPSIDGFSGNTNINTNKNEAVLPYLPDLDSNAEMDAELNEIPEDSMQNDIASDALPSLSKTCTITILNIQESTELDTEHNAGTEPSTFWNISATIADETVSAESDIINILVSDSDINAFEIGKAYEVELEKDENNEWYYLKGDED
jgi:hypothetical protein